LWVSELAAAFWQPLGRPEPIPRFLRDPIRWSNLDLEIREWRGLTVRTAERFLARKGAAWCCGTADRPLRACLAGCNGGGLILLDAADPPAERTFSLAHELAHFLRHYEQPRRRACRRLGERVAEVFDGRLAPTHEERIGALLAGVPLGYYVHWMERGPRPAARGVAAAEEEADRLAYELLAPAAAVAARVTETPGEPRPGEVAEMLREVFGLPAAPAEDYARLLVPAVPEDPLLGHLRNEQ
jgi:hypothetical protein